MDSCLFCRIIKGTERSWIIWEDKDHIAFLTPFPNTIGFTVVATKNHMSSYIFELDPFVLCSLIKAAQKVSLLLDHALDTKRTAIIAEGMGIDHAHIKLIPLHGLPDGSWQPVLSNQKTFYTSYPGYVSSHDGPRADDSELDRVADLVRKSKSG